ncbi:MAG: glutamate 5-kinase [Anaerolineae bacterium]|nr:glutamate 5-kinase [Anaerolineae bacterium]MCO5189886.1 glutamate 5-kinase [Anaerolineae bacterium]MCO5192344.1 glutamate 5-kinase [Anaerolineae bacterium]MCO5197554.1 glutamate 5-kinase [Anaerolineae bacterium]MCO5203823.1 glutamate 5-kinase [Anaerolineae bacterium]
MYQRIVVKLGTSVLTGGTPHLNRPHMVELARQCKVLYEGGHDIIICSSGAIAAGRERLGFPDVTASVTTKQMLAAVGQSRLMLMWEQFFEIYGIDVGQILLTRADVESRGRYLNARETFRALLARRIVPIVNENDAVATDEIKVGDNDNLSALVAILVEADLLLLLTDQPGLFTADPRSNPDAELIPEVRHIDATLKALAGGSGTTLGVGGMATKLASADIARRAGIDVVIASGRAPNIINRLASGEAMGTKFPALETPLESRKQWILAGPKPTGTLYLDAGAVHALAGNGRSLLPAGIVRVSGEFQRGDTVALVADSADLRQEIARGIVRYSHDELAQLTGCQSAEIEARLGYTYGSVAVHRNDLILL